SINSATGKYTNYIKNANAKQHDNLKNRINKNKNAKKNGNAKKNNVETGNIIKKCGQKAWTYAKKIRPGHIMFAMMLCMTCMNRCSTTKTPQSKSAVEFMQWSYEMGEQKVRDSVKIVELQNKIAADSMKYYHNLPK
ncbi:MAG: hypothetical protein LUB59_07525, partial [Candidatus Gastranaerophilales bacterium]|nr:hypothetical protein [Candidatus Gastranaerophilales bacterium]